MRRNLTTVTTSPKPKAKPEPAPEPGNDYVIVLDFGQGRSEAEQDALLVRLIGQLPNPDKTAVMNDSYWLEGGKPNYTGKPGDPGRWYILHTELLKDVNFLKKKLIRGGLVTWWERGKKDLATALKRL